MLFYRNKVRAQIFFKSKFINKCKHKVEESYKKLILLFFCVVLKLNCIKKLPDCSSLVIVGQLPIKLSKFYAYFTFFAHGFMDRTIDHKSILLHFRVWYYITSLIYCINRRIRLIWLTMSSSTMIFLSVFSCKYNFLFLSTKVLQMRISGGLLTTRSDMIYNPLKT